MSKPHFVLVHGAYHQAWHLKFLKEELEKAGHEVSAIDLPSCGENAPEEKAMTADTEAIKTALEGAASQSETIAPVFHSYSGLPGSDAVAELSEPARKKVLRLVYLASFALPQGTAFTPPSAQMAPWASVTFDGAYRYVPDPIPPFYHDVEPELAQEAARLVVKGSASAYFEKTKHAGWKMYPRTFIFCNDDRAAPRERLMAMFDSMSEEDRAGWKFEDIDGSHSPFLSRPAECAKLLIKIVDEARL